MKIRMIIGLIALLVIGFTSASAYADTLAGSVERFKGSVGATRNGTTNPLGVGSQINAGDTIVTGANARLRIRFLDNSTLTVGENAQILIDEMIYVPAGREPEKGKQAIKFVSGVFSYVSGKIGKSARQNVALNTPVATIGIRGTHVVGGELTVGMPPGQPHYGFQIREGAVDIITPQGTVTLDEPGEGTFLPLAGGKAPTPVRQWTPEEAAEATAALAF